MRLFIGTRINGGASGLIAEASAALLEEGYWRPAPVGQWHVTALFIGERDEKELPAMKRHLKRIASGSQRIVISNGQLCTMPLDEPRMLWVKFDPSAELTVLHHTLATALDAEPSKHYPYIPHITLARSKEGPPGIDGPMLLPDLELDHLTLFRTQLHPSGSVHEPLATYRLR